MLTETYRPTELAAFIGQPKAVAIARRIMATAPDGRAAILITGPSGTGKTTLARIIGRAWTGDNPIEEIDGDACSVDLVRGIGDRFRYIPMGGSAIVVNEFHAMTPRAVQAWLNVLERIPARTVVIFTSTESGDLFGQFSAPFASRCIQIPFTGQGLSDAMATRAQDIAREVGMDGRPLAQYKRLVQDHHNNMRAVLQAIESGAMLAGGDA